jgi:branched-chain amino acid transport system substrate-binding protein
VAELLIPGLRGNGWKVVASATYNKTKRNYPAVVAKVKASNPDVILIYADKEAVGPLLKLLKQEPSTRKTTILGGISFAFPTKLPSETLEGVIVVAPVCAISDRPMLSTSWLGKEFRKRDEKPPHMFAAFCFDSAMLVGRALKERGTSIESVQDYLETVKDYSGVTGLITLDDEGDAEVKWEIGVYQDGTLTPISKRK